MNIPWLKLAGFQLYLCLVDLLSGVDPLITKKGSYSSPPLLLPFCSSSSILSAINRDTTGTGFTPKEVNGIISLQGIKTFKSELLH